MEGDGKASDRDATSEKDVGVKIEKHNSADGPKENGGMSLQDYLIENVAGCVPSDSLGWLYVARGMYQTKRYRFAFEAATKALNHPHSQGEAAHLCAFSLYHLGQVDAALNFFKRSVAGGNETDFQMIVEIAIEKQREEDNKNKSA